MSFGGCKRNIYGATPPEILHAVLLGLCEYISESIELTFTESSICMISQTVVGIYHNSRRQSERGLPDMSPFKKGLFSVKSLKATERFARLFCLFLALCNSYLINNLLDKKMKKKSDDDVPAQKFTIQYLRGLKQVVEETLLFYLWMKNKKFPKSDFQVHDNQIDSRAMHCLKTYLSLFKNTISRGGNGLCTPKFHQILHTVDYIQRHGSPLNYDGSHGEKFGKVLIKDNAKLTNKQKDTLNFDIARRLAEEDILDQASFIYYENTGRFPSKYCNETDLMLGTQQNTNQDITAHTKNTHHAQYRLKVDIVNDVNNNSTTVEANIEWKHKKNLSPLYTFPLEILKKVATCLFVGNCSV